MRTSVSSVEGMRIEKLKRSYTENGCRKMAEDVTEL
jgi:hypothetical protein